MGRSPRGLELPRRGGLVEAAGGQVREAPGKREPRAWPHTAPGSPEGLRDLLLTVRADAYADQADDSFIQRFPEFVDHWTSCPGFTSAIAYDQDEPTGFAYGAPLPYGREWWHGHLPEPADPSTFGLSELMVHPS
ncbi:hypothetical protein ACIQWA_03145 [Kitasatospora sp. NPDC098652]|uniref:hypothetical protein n=1 Tax=Kitasatospora sp. NPDC098652 TaxID=3364095 RepID=UPI00381069DF